jgi:triosephosphate isomerase (TIM)
MTAPVWVGVSLKTYFGHARALAWLSEVAERVRDRAPLASGAVRLVILPTYLQIPAALQAFAGTPVQIGAQDVSAHPPGAFTGEIAAAELSELGVTWAEIGHAERRRLFGETDADTAAKAGAALAAGLRPLLCLGESEHAAPEAAAAAVVAQLHASLADAPAGAVTVAYEPVWAIGADAPASADHVAIVARCLRDALAHLPERAGSAVVYGGSAGPGLLTRLGDAVDGLFLGRFAHDPEQLLQVIDEAASRAEERA